jgi:hypothetical protein
MIQWIDASLAAVQEGRHHIPFKALQALESAVDEADKFVHAVMHAQRREIFDQSLFHRRGLVAAPRSAPINRRQPIENLSSLPAGSQLNKIIRRDRAVFATTNVPSHFE